MKVLVVGGGGREHAIVWALSKSPKVKELYCAPGNGGIASLATCVPIKATDVDAMVDWCAAHEMDFVVVAPDDPLALGMVDALEAKGIPAFGPPEKRRCHRGQQGLFQGPDGQIPHPHRPV